MTTINTKDMKDDETRVVPFMRTATETSTPSDDTPWLFYDPATGQVVERWDDHVLWDEEDDSSALRRIFGEIGIVLLCLTLVAAAIWYGIEYFTGV